MSRVLVLFAHPNQRRSNVNVRMARAAGELDGVTVADLYAEYPRYDVDVDAEQERLLAHDVVVLQFPFYWYSTPSIVKLWLDLVLEYGFAYGEGGDRLAGKTLAVATTAGGAEDAYAASGHNRFPIRTLLTPLEQTANLCRMRYLAPFVLFASLKAAGDDTADAHVERYARLLGALVEDRLDLEEATRRELLLEEALPTGRADGASGAEGPDAQRLGS